MIFDVNKLTTVAECDSVILGAQPKNCLNSVLHENETGISI
jgi:hypothetical protein